MTHPVVNLLQLYMLTFTIVNTYNMPIYKLNIDYRVSFCKFCYV